MPKIAWWIAFAQASGFSMKSKSLNTGWATWKGRTIAWRIGLRRRKWTWTIEWRRSRIGSKMMESSMQIIAKQSYNILKEANDNIKLFINNTKEQRSSKEEDPSLHSEKDRTPNDSWGSVLDPTWGRRTPSPLTKNSQTWRWMLVDCRSWR